MAKKKWLWLLPVAVLIATLVFLLLPKDAGDDFIIPDHIVICLDAGHGGDDPGAVNGDRQEKDDNLKMVLAIRDALEAESF